MEVVTKMPGEFALWGSGETAGGWSASLLLPKAGSPNRLSREPVLREVGLFGGGAKAVGGANEALTVTSGEMRWFGAGALAAEMLAGEISNTPLTGRPPARGGE